MTTRPLVRYHGGKLRLAPWLIASFFPSHRIYTETFGGGGSVLIRKVRCCAEVYNDLDGEIVNLFRVVRDRGHELAAALALTPFARDEFDPSYEAAEDSFEQARRTVCRAYMGFGSASVSGEVTGFRSSSSRSGTTPAHDWANYPKALLAVVERLQGVTIENRAATDILRFHDTAETLHYVDPLYVHSTRSIKQKGTTTKRAYRFELDDDAHAELAACVHDLKGMVVLSGYACELYDGGLYRDWQRFERTHRIDGTRLRTEVVWINPVCSQALANSRHQLFADTTDLLASAA